MKMINIQSNGNHILINIDHILTITDYMDKHENDEFFTKISLIDGTEIVTDELINDVLTKIREVLLICI